jgi:DNA-binding IclR family transcriptional regulator
MRKTSATPASAAAPADADRVVRLPSRGRPRGTGRAPVGIQAVEISLDILDRIVTSGAGLSLSALARQTGLKPNLLHRYLVSLTRRGLLAQAPLTGLYDLGPYARHLGLTALNRLEEMAHVHQFVTRFVAQTGHTLCIYIWAELGPTLIRLEVGTASLPFMLRVGSALPLITSATGRVFLAYMPDAITNPFVQRERDIAHTEGRTLPDLAAELAAIRADSVYITKEAIIPTLAVVGPIADANGVLFCTLTALAPLGGTRSDASNRLAADMREAVATLSRDLFGPRPNRAG